MLVLLLPLTLGRFLKPIFSLFIKFLCAKLIFRAKKTIRAKVTYGAKVSLYKIDSTLFHEHYIYKHFILYFEKVKKSQ